MKMLHSEIQAEQKQKPAYERVCFLLQPAKRFADLNLVAGTGFEPVTFGL